MISIQMLYALDLFDKKQYSESMKIFLDLNTNPHDVIKLFADFINPSKSEFQPGSQLPADVKQGLTAYIEYLTVMRRRVQTPPVTEDEEEKKKILKKNSDLLVTIDTTLLKCYLQVKLNKVMYVIFDFIFY